MEGFFDIQPREKPIITPKKKNNKQHTCDGCGLYQKAHCPKMKVQGKGDKKILIVGDPVSRKADVQGRQFTKEYTKILEEACEEVGIDYKNDTWHVNAIQCYGKKHSPATIQGCKARLRETISELNPKSVVVLGEVALNVLIGHKQTINVSGSDKEQTHVMGSWVGWEIPDQEYKTYLIPTYSPLELIEERYSLVYVNPFVNAFKAALDTPEWEIDDASNSIRILKGLKDIKWELEHMTKQPLTAFDYESTGLKPYNKGHEIICMSIADGNYTISFEITPAVIPYVRKYLESKNKKIAHNIKFEMLWSQVIFNAQVHNVYYDTMIAAHILNNATGITGLKFQTYVHFGVSGYGSEIAPLFKGNKGEKHANAFNKLYALKQENRLNMVLDMCLEYCALDSYYTFKLATIQMEQFQKTPFIWDGFNLFMEGVRALQIVERNGIRIDIEEAVRQFNKLGKKIEALKEIIYDTEEAKKWKNKKPLNIDSGADLVKLLYDILHYPVYKETKKKGRSVDADSLEKIMEKKDSEFIKYLLLYKKAAKLKDTFLKGIIDETTDGYLHPFFNLNTVKSFRSSSSNLNFQNLPKRDKKAYALIRSLFKPRKGHMLVDFDFKSLEVNISECYHKDKNMFTYLTAKDADMHRDTACDIFLRTKETLLPDERQITKGAFVFAQFYGDYYVKCAKNLWDNMKKESKVHLSKKGIKNLDDFTDHIQEVERIFWNERFKEYNKWKKKNEIEYEKNGYIDFYTGFRVIAPMRRNQANNIAIQGSAFHCLLWLLIFTQKELRKRGMRSCIVGQIHDSMVCDVHPDELDELKDIIEQGLKAMKKHWTWIFVPLTLEYEMAPVDAGWNQLAPAGSIYVA